VETELATLRYAASLPEQGADFSEEQLLAIDRATLAAKLADPFGAAGAARALADELRHRTRAERV
jgi:hypothetical protein